MTISFLDTSNRSIDASDMANIEIRSQGWSPLSNEDMASRYSELNTKLGKLKVCSILTYRPIKNDLTLAENFGKYVRELFEVYRATLEEMKSSREWVALQVRSTCHSKAGYSDSIVIGEENDPDQFQIRGFQLDPLVFDFKWQDNSMDLPWKPWGWQIGIFSDDLDETHYFFDLKSKKHFVAKDSEISFYDMTPILPKELTLFRLS